MMNASSVFRLKAKVLSVDGSLSKVSFKDSVVLIRVRSGLRVLFHMFLITIGNNLCGYGPYSKDNIWHLHSLSTDRVF